MVVEAHIRCGNCGEPITVSYVLVHRPSTDKAPRECPLCDDREAVAGVLEAAHEKTPGKRPLLLSVRHGGGPDRNKA